MEMQIDSAAAAAAVPASAATAPGKAPSAAVSPGTVTPPPTITVGDGRLPQGLSLDLPPVTDMTDVGEHADTAQAPAQHYAGGAGPTGPSRGGAGADTGGVGTSTVAAKAAAAAAAAAAAVAVAQHARGPAPDAAGAVGLQPVPTPPVVVVTASDSCAWPKLKLQELFVQWMVKPENATWLTSLMDEARSNKVSAPNSSPLTSTPAPTPAPPGSPVSRLIHSHLPFGGSPRGANRLTTNSASSPSSSTSSHTGASAGTANTSIPVATDLDLGKTALHAVGAVGGALGGDVSPVASAEAAAAAKAAFLDGFTAHGSPKLRSSPSSRTGSDSCGTTPVNVGSFLDQRQALDSVADGIAGMKAHADLIASPPPVPIGAADTTAMTVSASEPNRVGSAKGSAAVAAGETGTCASREATEKSPSKSTVTNIVGGEGKSVAAKAECIATAETSENEMTDSDAPAAVRQASNDACPTAGLPPPYNDAMTDEPKTIDSKQYARRRRSTIPPFYHPKGKDAEAREERELKDMNELFAKFSTAKGGVDGLTRAEFADVVSKVVGMPRFFAPVLFDRLLAVLAMRHAVQLASASDTTAVPMEATSAVALAAEDSGNVAASSSPTAVSSAMSVGANGSPNNIVGTNGDSSGMLSVASDGSVLGGSSMMNGGSAHNGGSGSSSNSADSHMQATVQSHAMVDSGSDVERAGSPVDSANGQASGNGPNGEGSASADDDRSSSMAVDTAGSSVSPDVEPASTGAMGAGLSAGSDGAAGGSVPMIREAQFRDFYMQECKGRSLESRMFGILLELGATRDYLIPSDFKPLLRALLMCHQGLAFLHATPEFQLRYSETVIERIYFSCTRKHNGRLYEADIRRSRLLDTLRIVDEEEDINRERRYFSYEHFYVLYCRFWELDTDHDLQIDREDLMRYGGHSLTYRIVDRIFGGFARPLDNVDNAGMMSYTDFIWFCLSEEDKSSETAIDYWYRCVDMDGDGVITMYDMEFFFKEQLHRLECFGHEPIQICDILCQLLDMVKPNATPPQVTRSDLKSSRLAGNFFNILFNLNKLFATEARDPLQIRQEHATPELTDWDRFAALEYLRLSAEEEEGEEENWEEVETSSPLIAGEAPF